jgi:hypothetical protein
MSLTTIGQKYTIVAALAESENDSNVVENIFDGKLETRWSNLGIGSEIVLDIGTINNPVRVIGIRWFYPEGQLGRRNLFDIQLSTDNISYQNVITNRKSDGNLNMEYYEFERDYEARYVKIIVNGNDNNEWASIVDVEILLKKPISQTEEFDKFGLRMLYPTANHTFAAIPFAMGDQRWKERIEIGMDNYSRWNNGIFTGENSGDDKKIIVKDQSRKDARYNIYAISKDNYEDTNISTYNRNILTEQGYMQTRSDWKNVEITGYVYVEEVSDNGDEVTYYARGGKHSPGNRCEGSALKASVKYDGRIKINKETRHGDDNIQTFSAPSELKGGIVGKWIGFKYCLYNKEINGRFTPRMELYVDFLDAQETKVDSNGKPKNLWIKVRSHDDSTDWGSDGGNCNGAPTRLIPIVWGGPIVTMRWDRVKKVNLKWVSVREIVPPA